MASTHCDGEASARDHATASVEEFLEVLAHRTVSVKRRGDYRPWHLSAGLSRCSCRRAVAAAFDVQGHRGARGLAPENTLAAFRAALDIGVSTLETDLAVTRDGVLVLTHDPQLNPALDARRRRPLDRRAGTGDPQPDASRTAALRRRSHRPVEPLRPAVAGAEGGRRRAHPGARRTVRAGAQPAHGWRRAGAPESRNEGHAGQRRNGDRPRGLRPPAGDGGAGRAPCRPRDDPVVRLAHAGRGQAGRRPTSPLRA